MPAEIGLPSQRNSTDESNKNNGGDLGWIGPDDSYDADFLAGAFALNDDGQISDPVKSQFGWHLIQLVTKATNPVSSSKFAQMKQNFFSDWLEEIRTSRDDIVIEENWAEFAPETLPCLMVYNYVISPTLKALT